MKTINQEQTLLEKYVPQDFQQLRIPARIRSIIENAKNRVGYRLLLYGIQGTGKTTTARLLHRERDKYDILYLSGSNDFNVETLRTKVVPFISGQSLTGSQKSVIIDECENISNKIQDAFKIILDSYTQVNFIFITNEIEKIIEPILSRFTKVEFNFSNQELREQEINYLEHFKNIIVSEGMDYDSTGLSELYKQNFPDFRQSLIVLQQLKDSQLPVTKNNVLLNNEVGRQNLELYNIIQSEHDPQKIYEFVSRYSGHERECIATLAEPYFRYLNQNNMHDKTLKAAVIVCRYSEYYTRTINKFSVLLALVVELNSLFK